MQTTTAQIGIAGDTYNSAVYLSLLAKYLDVFYITALGTDSMSVRILKDMQRYGINDKYVERREGKSPGLYAIETDSSGERSFTYWRNDSAARTLFAKPCAIRFECFDDFDLICLSGISLAILPAEIRKAIFEAIDSFRSNGGLIAYDSNHRPALWESLDAAREVNTQMWKRTDIGFPSIDDELAIFGEKSEEDVLFRLASAGLKCWTCHGIVPLL